MSDMRTEANRYLKRESAKWPWHLVEVPGSQWPAAFNPRLARVLRSRDFLVQVFEEEGGVVRLSVNRAVVKHEGWDDGISWDELQRLKHQAGYGSFDAVEVYPRNNDVVNVANMRHLWVFTSSTPLAFIWRKRGGAA